MLICRFAIYNKKSGLKVNYKDITLALSKIGIALTSETNPDNLFTLIINKVIEFTKCDACSLFIREYDPDRLIFRASRTLSLEKKNPDYLRDFKAFPVRLESKSIASYTALTGKIINIPDCYAISEKEECGFNSSYDSISRYKTTSLLSVPMKLSDGKIIGVIQLINKLDENDNIIPFPKELEEIISSIASQAAVAIHNVILKNIQSESSAMFIVLTLSLCIYSFFIAAFKNSALGSIYNANEIMNMVISSSFLIIAFILVRKSKLPISSFGVTLRNVKKSIVESLWVTVAVLLLITLVKIWAMAHWPLFKGIAFIDTREMGWAFYIYLFVAPVQEFFTRGVLQSTVERIIPGKYNWLWGIVVASYLFGAFHIHYSFELAYITIISGFLWGYMYIRHRTIVGVSISHFFIGNYLVLTRFWDLVFKQ